MIENEAVSPPSTVLSGVPWGPWLALLVAINAYVVSIILSSVIAVYLLPKNISDLDGTVAIYSLSSVMLILSAWGFLRLKKYSWRDFFGRFRALHLAYLPLFYGVYFFLTYIVQFILSAIPGYNGSESQSFGLSGAEGHTLIGVLVVLVILPPIAEEIVFRGILYRGMKNRWGRVVAALITSSLFGLAHGQWNVAADTFVLSLVLIAALETTKSLYLPMAVHMLKNFVAYLLVFVLLK